MQNRCWRYWPALFGSLLGLPQLIVLLTAPPARAQSGDRWALLVGIAAYKRSEFSLLGPVNDIAHMKRMLIQRGFAADHIRVCQDQDATRRGILAGWDWLEAHARAGDLALFYYSGHGTVVPPEPGDARRQMRSALVPFDTVDARGLLLGKDIGARIDRLATDQVVVIVDACHSGRASRLPCVRSRFIAPSRLGLPPEATPAERRSRQWIYSEFAGAPEPRTPPQIKAPPNRATQKEVYLGASRVDQTASEDTFLPTKGDYRTNASMGAFTYYLLDEANRDRAGKLTYKALVDRVRGDLLRRYGREQVDENGVRQPTQEPQLSGSVPVQPGFLWAAASAIPPKSSDTAPELVPTPTVTLASIRAPLRVAVESSVSADQRARLKLLPDVLLVTVGEPNDAVVESVGTGGNGNARVWRGRIPLEPRAWNEVPALLSRLHAAVMLERLGSGFAARNTGERGVHLRANGEASYTETAIGGGVTLTVTSQSSGYVTLLVAGADGTLTGISDVPIIAGETRSFPSTAKGPVGIDSVEVLLTGERTGLRLPAAPTDARAHRPGEIVFALTQKLLASPTRAPFETAADTLLVRIRGGE